MKTEKLKISENNLRRLRIMYAVDIATYYHNSKSLEKAFFEDGLNPEWIKLKNILRDFNGELSDWQVRELKETGKTSFGCFKIRDTGKSYIFYTNLIRVPKVR